MKVHILYLHFAILLLCPLMLGTTTVIRENGTEVGRMVENDGVNQIKFIDQDTIKTGLSKESTKSVLNTIRADMKGEDASLRKERLQDWGISKGMSRTEVDRIARAHGVVKNMEYSAKGDSPELLAKTKYPLHYSIAWFWVYEYDYKTEHFYHTKKVYFGPSQSGPVQEFVYEEHQADPII